jgi:hypothetical protein
MANAGQRPWGKFANLWARASARALTFAKGMKQGFEDLEN